MKKLMIAVLAMLMLVLLTLAPTTVKAEHKTAVKTVQQKSPQPQIIYVVPVTPRRPTTLVGIEILGLRLGIHLGAVNSTYYREARPVRGSYLGSGVGVSVLGNTYPRVNVGFWGGYGLGGYGYRHIGHHGHRGHHGINHRSNYGHLRVLRQPRYNAHHH